VVALIGFMLVAGNTINTNVGVHSVKELPNDSSVNSSTCQKSSFKNRAKLLKDLLELQISRANSIWRIF
jgi:hypothetical protein